MSRRLLTLPLLGMAALAAAVALSGCGKMGDLERPGPLFGAGRNTTKEADEAVRQAQDPSRPVDTVNPRDRNVDPAPPRTAPIGGLNNDPSQAPPPGALPDPYNNPR